LVIHSTTGSLKYINIEFVLQQNRQFAVHRLAFHSSNYRLCVKCSFGLFVLVILVGLVGGGVGERLGGGSGGATFRSLWRRAGCELVIDVGVFIDNSASADSSVSVIVNIGTGVVVVTCGSFRPARRRLLLAARRLVVGFAVVGCCRRAIALLLAI
jgi:hypothetical protein